MSHLHQTMNKSNFCFRKVGRIWLSFFFFFGKLWLSCYLYLFYCGNWNMDIYPYIKSDKKKLWQGISHCRTLYTCNRIIVKVRQTVDCNSLQGVWLGEKCFPRIIFLTFICLVWTGSSKVKCGLSFIFKEWKITFPIEAREDTIFPTLSNDTTAQTKENGFK